MKKLFLILLAPFFVACSQIDTGNVGVESTLGQVKQETLPPGVYFTAFKKMTEVCAKELPLSLNDMKPQTFDKITLSDLDVDIYIQLAPTQAPMVMTKWPGDMTEEKGDDCVRVGMNYVTRQAREAIYIATAKFKSDIVHTKRNEIVADTVKELQSSLDNDVGKGVFMVKSANIRNLVTDVALEKNIKDAANAQFQLQAERQLLEVTKVQADRKREEAKGEADAIRIKAEAVSKQGGAEYVQLQAIQKWDGKLPVTQAGGAIPFINVK